MDRKSLELAHKRGRNLSATIDSQTLLLIPKVFKTGSLGWHGQGKVTIDDTRCQLSVVVTVIGSKDPGFHHGQGNLNGELNTETVGEQLSNASKNVPEAPPDESPLFGDQLPKKRSRKRS